MNKKILCLALVFAMVLPLLAGCGSQQEPSAEKKGLVVAPQQTLAVKAEAMALAEAPEPPVPVSTVLLAEPSGEKEERCAEAVVDYSHTGDGYVMAKYLTYTDKRIKVQVKGPTTTYTYNLPMDTWTVFPLSDGEGNYQVVVYKNTTGSRYAAVMSASFSVTLADEFAPFLRPNQYVDYSDAPVTVEKGAQLCAGLENPLDKVAAVYDYVVSTFSYDYDKAASVKSGYLPVLDDVMAAKKGICFDYAAVMSAMLRSQNVPCKLVVGYAGDIYHAWINVWTEDNGWIDGVIFFDGQVWKRMDPTFASSQDRSSEIMDYIENGNYTVKYLY